MARAQTLREAVPGLRRTLRRFGPHIRDERRLLIGGFVALLVEVAMRLLEPWPLKYVLDAVVAAEGATLRTDQPGNLQTVLVVATAALVAAVALRSLASYLMTVLLAHAGNRILSRVRTELYAHLHTLSMAFHDGARTGDLVTRVTGDIGRLQEATVTAALPLVGNLVTLIGMFVVIAILDWQLALLVALVFPVFLLTSVRLTRRLSAVSRSQRQAEGALASLATESLGSMQVVQAYSLEQQMQSSFGSSNAKSFKDGVKAKKLSAGLERKTDVLVGLATALVLYVGAGRVLTGVITPGELVVFLTYLKTAFRPMRDLAKYTARLAKAGASGERIVDILDTCADITDRPGACPAPPFLGQVRFEKIHMSYVSGHPVLSGLDLQVRAGERIAIVGPSGSGKSTLVSLLTRLREPEHGRVLVDGIDLVELTLESVRRQVAIVLQDSVLFAVSVRDNIAFGLPGASDEQVEAAARLAGAHEFVRTLPLGYDTVLGERGSTLSGGQRQRIAIARAAIRDAPLVVLDEALTGLDEDTEAEVVAALNRLTEGRTTFVITHDLAAAAGADRVVCLDDGRITYDSRPVPPPVRRRRASAAAKAIHAHGG